MSLLAVWCPNDHLLSVLAPLGLALGRQPTLVVDLDPNGPRFDGSRYTLAELVRNGPTHAQLRQIKGAHVLPNGGVAPDRASAVVEALARHWPRMVLRCDPHGPRPDGAVAFQPLLPVGLRPSLAEPVVYQRMSWRGSTPTGAVVLRQPSRGTVDALLGLRRPPRHMPWIKDLARLWPAT